MSKRFSTSQRKKLEDLFKKYGYKVRFEKGQFQSDACMVEDKNLIVVNAFLEHDQKVEALLEIGKKSIFDDIDMDKKETSFVESLLNKMYAQV